MKNKRVTIKDIANALGLHHTTVSLALRNSPKLKDETRAKIQAMAKKMGYRPNLLAQGFRKRSSNTIGVLVPAIHHHFFSKFISETTDLAFESGYALMVLQSNENLETEKINLESLIQNRVAGVIGSVSLETKSCRHLKVFEDEGIPLVLIDRIPDDYHGIAVVVNNYQLAYDAVECMIKKGKKRIAFITSGSHINVFRDRIRGYKAAMKRYVQTFDEFLIIESGFEMLNGERAAKKLMSNKIIPDGILAVNDRVAMGAMKYLKKSGYRIPEDISVIGFDNDPMGLAIEPELTTCIQYIEKIAKTSFDALMDQIENKGEFKKRSTITGGIIHRNSC